MRRHLLTLALATLFGSALLVSDASACCHKRRTACVQTCVVAAPCPPPVAQCRQPRRRLFAGLCHKRKAVCAPVVAYAPAPCATPVVYGAPQSVVVPSGQASPQR
jgi:hypothetical protein